MQNGRLRITKVPASLRTRARDRCVLSRGRPSCDRVLGHPGEPLTTMGQVQAATTPSHWSGQPSDPRRPFCRAEKIPPGWWSLPSRSGNRLGIFAINVRDQAGGKIQRMPALLAAHQTASRRFDKRFQPLLRAEGESTKSLNLGQRIQNSEIRDRFRYWLPSDSASFLQSEFL